MHDAFVYDGIRTPFGRFGGALAGTRPDDLAAHVVRAIVARAPGLAEQGGGAIDEVVFGNANGAGEENRNVARMASLLAGLPTSVPGSTVNRLCGSSLDAVIIASRQIETGDAEVVLAGGVESMSRAPWVLPKTERLYPAADLNLASTTLGWRLVNPAMPKQWTVSLGEATEQLREQHGITRESQDTFAARSHRLADQAWADGFYDDLVVAMPGVDLARDESIRPDTTPERLANLTTVFRTSDAGGTVTAGNASPLNDGASAVMLGSARAAERIGLDPVARVAARGAGALDPQLFGYAPVEAANLALERAGIRWGDVSAIELNEAFAAQSLACLGAWPVDPDIVNRHGGALAIGHPLGASGGRIVATLARSLQRSGGRWGWPPSASGSVKASRWCSRTSPPAPADGSGRWGRPRPLRTPVEAVGLLHHDRRRPARARAVHVAVPDTVTDLVVDQVDAVRRDVLTVGVGAEQPAAGVEHHPDSVVAADLPVRLQRRAELVGGVGAGEGDAQVGLGAGRCLRRRHVDEANVVARLPSAGVGEVGDDDGGVVARVDAEATFGLDRVGHLSPCGGDLLDGAGRYGHHGERAGPALNDLGGPGSRGAGRRRAAGSRRRDRLGPIFGCGGGLVGAGHADPCEGSGRGSDGGSA